MIHLHLPTPCHEDWDAMTPRDQGRHCASCQKTVVDFTAMSDAQLVRFFTEYGKDEQVCGRLRTTQLERPLTTVPDARVPWKLAASLVAGLGLSTAANAQHTPPPSTGRVAIQQAITTPEPEPTSSCVIDAATGEPLIGVTVEAYGATGALLGGTTTDADGRFSLQDLPPTTAKLEISYPGYHPQQFDRPDTETVRIQLVDTGTQAGMVISAPIVREVEVVLGGLSYSYTKKRPWWKRIFPRPEWKSWGPNSNEAAARSTEALSATPRTTPVEAPPAPRLTVTPNPARTEVQVRFPAGLVFPVQLRWISVDGRVLRTQTVAADEPTVFQLPKGGNGQRTLLLSITDTNGQVTTERIVQTIE